MFENKSTHYPESRSRPPGRIWEYLIVPALLLLGCVPPEATGMPTSMDAIPESWTDRSLFTDTPCSSPCWYGLQLGKSSKGDVLEALRAMSFLDGGTIREAVSSYWDTTREASVKATLVAAECRQPKGQQCAGLIVVNDKLVSIGLFPTFSIAFGDLIDHLGVPDYVRVSLGPPVHEPACSTKLIWVQRQIIADHTDVSSNKRCGELRSGNPLDESLVVHSLLYVLPNDIQLTSIPQPGSDYPWREVAP